MQNKKLTPRTLKPGAVLKDLELSSTHGKTAVKDPKGGNVATGETIKIPAKKVAKFR